MSNAMNATRRHFIGAGTAALAAAGFGLSCAKVSSTMPAPAEVLPIEGNVPSFDGAIGWLNSAPLTAAGLRGKVILVQFWTYTCINWLRTLAYVRAWDEKYRDHGLVVIGVHTPEFSFEHNVENVRQAAAAMRIGYPIAIDNDYAIWDAFANHYWPALYFVDAMGRIRHHHFGEGAYDESEGVIRKLLGEAGAAEIGPGLVSVDAQGEEVAADWDALASPESYLGLARAQNFASAGQAPAYTAPAQLKLNHWALEGDWTVGNEAIVLNAAGGRIADQFQARDLHLVMGPSTSGTSIDFRVLVDGQLPAAAHGVDVDDDGNGTLTEQRLYQLVRQPMPVVERRFEIEFLDAGAAAYAFTFG